MDKPRIIFLHIHKTAGMSLRGLLVKNYRERPHFNSGIHDITEENFRAFLQKVDATPTEELERVEVFKGHMLFGLHDHVPGPIEYLTFLREPVARTASHYRMDKRKGILPAHHQIDPRKPDSNMTGYPGYFRYLDNYQTRILSGAPLDLPFGCVTEAHLQKARENIERYFRFVGVTERFDEALILLRRHASWKWHFYVPDNVSVEAHTPLSPEILSALRDQNRLDTILYTYTQERCRKLVRQGGLSFQTEYRLFRLGNRLHRLLHNLKKRMKKPELTQNASAPEAVLRR
jgi:hypothetical protein